MTGPLFENFECRVGDVFTVIEEGVPVLSLTLEAASLLSMHNGPQGMRQPFQLTFLGADPDVFQQRLYRLTHGTLGEMEIFLVPSGRDTRGVSYCATFS